MTLTKTKLAVAGVLTAATLLGVTVGAQAQNAAQKPGVTAGQRAIDPAARQAQMETRRAERTKALHDILAITPAQEGAWRAYQAALTPPARAGQGGHGMRQGMEALTTPQRLDKMVEQANARHTEMLSRANATRQFYSQLSASQKTAFDALPQMGPGQGGRGGPGMDRGGRGPGGEGMGPRGGRGGFGQGPGAGQRGPGPRGQGPVAPAN